MWDVVVLMTHWADFCASLLGFTESLLDLNNDGLNGCLVSMEPSPRKKHPFMQSPVLKLLHVTFAEYSSVCMWTCRWLYNHRANKHRWLLIKEPSRHIPRQYQVSRCSPECFSDQRGSKRAVTVKFLCLPLPLMWAPGNTADYPAPQQPGRTCDSPSGCRPRTGAPLHHPVKTNRTSVCVLVHRSVRVKSRENPNSPTHMHAHPSSWIKGNFRATKALKVFHLSSIHHHRWRNNRRQKRCGHNNTTHSTISTTTVRSLQRCH